MLSEHTTDAADAAPRPNPGPSAGPPSASAGSTSGALPGDAAPLADRRREDLRRALSTLSYEILPFKSTEEEVLAHVPQSTPLSITTTQAKGLAPTLDLAANLTGHGYSVSPHIAARQVRDRHHLVDLVAQWDEAGITSVFVIGGDADEPVGEYSDALELLRSLEECGHHLERIGIGGYPEGHGSIETGRLESAVREKAPHATHMVSQLCFDASTTITWARRLQASGVHLPIHVGLPGAVSRQKLVRISANLGLGQSARFLKKQQSMLWRFFLPGGYRPDRLVGQLAPQLSATTTALFGFHLFTFNELKGTESWRRAWLSRLEEDA